MGHFGKGPIRWSWYAIVLPALLLSYAGQTAFIMEKGTVTGNPFFQIAPAWSLYPLVALATIATIIASQAIITGSFSMTRQAMQLGWLPGVSIRQTSDRIYGQIYVPVVNWLLMTATVATTIAFGSSDRLAGAYGTAVSTTMLLTTVLLYKAMRDVWHWPFAAAIAVFGIFLAVDASFFCANLLKIVEGGWLPLSLAAALFLAMITWRTGIEAMHAALMQTPEAAERFLSDLKSGAIPRVDGTIGVSDPQQAKGLAAHHGSRAFHRGTAAQGDRSQRRVREHAAHQPSRSVRSSTRWAKVCGTSWFASASSRSRTYARRWIIFVRREAAFDFDQAVFVAARDLVVRKPQGSALAGWRVALFAFLYRNSAKNRRSLQSPARPGDRNRQADRDLDSGRPPKSAYARKSAKKISGRPREGSGRSPRRTRSGRLRLFRTSRAVSRYPHLPETSAVRSNRYEWAACHCWSIPAMSRLLAASGRIAFQCRGGRPRAGCSR